MDLDVSFSRLYTVNKAKNIEDSLGGNKKIYIGYTHIYTMHIIFEENIR